LILPAGGRQDLLEDGHHEARVQLPTADLDEHGRARLSYQQAEALFAKASGGPTLHGPTAPEPECTLTTPTDTRPDLAETALTYETVPLQVLPRVHAAMVTAG
jgi:hypothetical protein